MAKNASVGRGELRALLAEHGISPKRSLGQNFLVDPNTAERIVRLAEVVDGDWVVEIGAGLGSLTLALAASGAAVTAIEIDGALAELVSSRAPAGVRVVEADAMSCDWDAVLDGAGESDRDWVLVANLPYNIATPLLIDLLEHVPRISRGLVMVQAEVGERLAAPAGSRIYGASSVRIAYFAEARVVGRISPEVFYPRPNVDSVLVAFARRSVPAVDPGEASYAEIDELVRAGFAGRRKMLRRSLRGLVPPSAFECAGIPEEARAEQLDVAAWGKLAGCRRSTESSPAPS